MSSNSYQAILPGQSEPGVCIHPISNREYRPTTFPCKSCEWCFREEAWGERSCFRTEGICPLKEHRCPHSHNDNWNAAMRIARKKVKIAAILSRK